MLDKKFSELLNSESIISTSEGVLDNVSFGKDNSVFSVNIKNGYQLHAVGSGSGETEDNNSVISDNKQAESEEQFQLLVNKLRESGKSVSELDELVSDNPNIPIEQLKKWAIKAKGFKLSALLNKAIREERFSVATEDENDATFKVGELEGEFESEQKQSELIVPSDIEATGKDVSEKTLDPIPIGQEPENIKKRLDTLFEKLNSAYPDKEIFRLDTDHKKWGETATDLYRKLGYSDRRLFLEAYGFTFKEGLNSGRPSARINDVPADMFFDELKTRYPNGLVYTTAKELLRANPDLQGGYDFLRKKAQERFGMPLHEYMKKEGFLCTPETAFRLLKDRYAQPFEGTIDELYNANEDLKWKMINDYSCEARFVSLEECLYQNGILKDSPEEAKAKASAKELSFLLEEIKKRVNGEKYANVSGLMMSSELSDLRLGRLNKLIRTVHHVEPLEFLVQEGIVMPQTNGSIEQKESKGKRNQPISTRDNEALGRAVINQGNLLSAGFTGKIAVVPEGVHRIGKQAFSDNDAVEIVYLSSSLKTIDEKGFYNCHHLKTVYYDGKQLEAGPECFYGCEELAFIGNSKTMIINPAFYDYLSMQARVRSLVEDMVSLQSEYLKERPSDKTKRLARLEIAALVMHLMRETSEFSSQMRQLLNCICGGEVSVGEVVESVVTRKSEFEFLRLFYQLRRHQRYHARDRYLRVVRRVINCIQSFVQNNELNEKSDELLLALREIKDRSY